jgi:hypothetical protein
MARDILSDYGRDSASAQSPRATNGGRQTPKDIPYDRPKGPSGQIEQGPGLHGTNHGTCGTQGKH